MELQESIEFGKQREVLLKKLSIAKSIFGEPNVDTRQTTHETEVRVVQFENVGFQGFDPYGHSPSSYIVQQYFKIGVSFKDDVWTASDANNMFHVENVDLRTAIADVAALLAESDIPPWAY